jgi:peptidoglycan/xylan/chitin deacetylase (PgdA/CDA1 family)
MSAWLLLLALAAAPSPAAAPTAFAWPRGAQAAVSLSYDDALDSQLDHAAPALDRHGLKASFYLTLSSPVLARRLPEWRALAANGHELGNHTLFHQCRRSLPGRDWVTPERDLDHTSAAQMLEQVRVGNAMLQAIDGRTERTFTLPCGDRLASGVDYLPLLHDDFVAIKAGEGGVVADMQALDVYAVGVTAPSNVSGAQLIALVEQARARGTMVNFTFHGVGGDYLAVSTQTHDELLAYLAAHRRKVWTDTFLHIMAHVKHQQAAVASAAHRGGKP